MPEVAAGDVVPVSVIDGQVVARIRNPTDADNLRQSATAIALIDLPIEVAPKGDGCQPFGLAN